MKVHIKDIDSYIALQPMKVRTTLEKLRTLIKDIAPDSEEVISYGMPAFKYHGMLVGFAATKNHLGFYPWNGSTVKHFKEDLEGYKTSPGAIQFPWGKPLPLALIKKIVKWRIQENKNKIKK